MEYKQTRRCGSCEFQVVRKLTKREAAFVELRNQQELWDMPCPECGSKKCESVTQSLPVLDQELFDEWGISQNLSFCEQDEEIVLAEPIYLQLILDGIDSSTYLNRKKHILIEALCVLLYDALFEDERVYSYDAETEDEYYSDEENIERQKIAETVKTELLKRKDMLTHPDQWIESYVKEVVFPYIGLKSD